MERVVFFPGYLTPPAGFRGLAQALAGYQALELERQANPLEALATWMRQTPPAAHLVAFAEAGWAAVQVAAQTKAKSLVLFSPVIRVDAALEARLGALEMAHRYGFFAQAAKPWMFGSFFLEQGQEAIEVWTEGLAQLQLQPWLESMLALPDGRKHLRRLECPVLVVLGAEDAFSPLRYGQEVVEWVPLNSNGLGAVRVSLEGCGHLAAWENPLESANLTEGFIRRPGGLLEDVPDWGETELPMG